MRLRSIVLMGLLASAGAQTTGFAWVLDDSVRSVSGAQFPVLFPLQRYEMTGRKSNEATAE